MNRHAPLILSLAIAVAATALIADAVAEPARDRMVACRHPVLIDGLLHCDAEAPLTSEPWCPRAPTVLHAGDAVTTATVCTDGPSRMAAEDLVALRVPIDLNSATPTDLDSLPGVGPTTAARIIGARPFDSVDQLLDVRGIGPARLAQIRPRARVEPVLVGGGP